MQILSAKAFNEMQDNSYKEYCAKCIANGVQPSPKSAYFFTIDVNYGYVQFSCNRTNIRWKKRKKDFG